ncbi:hypothetical protein SASPL_141248 [Salvia splendens]|uniref:Uncharacterized protein n=1 Tax=Salvia splendens TaxID=180675 RepID=A0A8X8ZCN9_SALSN|nr:hypothetical protein SASPL_141248 [Salvia splendens]
MQHSGQLELSLKCQLISKHISKITDLLVPDAMQRYKKDLHCDDDKRNMDPVPSLPYDVPVIGVDAIIRSNSTLEDFLDDLNEKLVQIPMGEDPTPTGFEDDEPNLCANSVHAFKKNPFQPLFSVLERYGLLTERIQEELRYGEEYWHLERKLCCAVARNKEDDVAENSFNILRMFVNCYGASAAPIMLEKFISEAEEKYDRLFKALDEELSVKYRERCEEATREG